MQNNNLPDWTFAGASFFTSHMETEFKKSAVVEGTRSLQKCWRFLSSLGPVNMYFMSLMKIKCKIMFYYFTWNILCLLWPGFKCSVLYCTLCSKFSLKPRSSSMIATNPLFSKFFPYVFLFSYIWPSGADIFLSMFSNQRKAGCVPCSAGMRSFGLQLCVGVSCIWSVSAVTVLKWVRAKDECLCMCMCMRMRGCACVLTQGDVSTWMKGANSTLIRNKSWKTAGSKSCQL